jgi:hypothetical protein
MTFGMLPISMSSRNERHLAPSETWREQKALQPTPRSFTFSRRAGSPYLPSCWLPGIARACSGSRSWVPF